MAEMEDVYCTLVLSDSYLPGAAVLAHSLRDAGTTKKLACLVLHHGLRDSTLTELRTLYNYVIPIEPIGNPNPANLYLMNRPDLLYTFSKIHLWAQTQFRKILYIDADVVALRAPEELFQIQERFAAAPDVGWPDAFNTGVMLMTPDIGEYHALRGLANAGDSFDGADQGLLNQYYEYRPWKRISFTYNATPSANYQYEPAYRYYKRDISLVHFIGADKPWMRGRAASETPNAFQEMLSRWWAVYDRHFRLSPTEYTYGTSDVVHHNTRHGQQQPAAESYSAGGYPIATTGPAPPPHELPRHDIVFHQPEWHGTQTHHTLSHEQHRQSHHGQPSATSSNEERAVNTDNVQPHPVETMSDAQQRKFSAPHMEWDATRGAPPVESKPEAANFPTQIYEFNTNPQLFRAPKSYPEPPRDMWYSVPNKTTSATRPQPIFPWEQREMSKPTRRFIDDDPPSPPPPVQPDTNTESFTDELEVTVDGKLEPLTPTIRAPSDPFAFAPSKNAWDDVAGIENYVRALTSFHRSRGNVQILQQNEVDAPELPLVQTGQAQQHVLSPSNEPDPEKLVEEIRDRRESLILTDFPSAVERPSLPVTPAPRRRPTFWGDEGDEEVGLPIAEGVPDQVDWDPSTQLEELRRRNSLIEPGSLKLPQKALPQRQMPATAVPLISRDVVLTSSGESATRSNLSNLSGGGSPHGLDTPDTGNLSKWTFNSSSTASATGYRNTRSTQSGASTVEFGETTSSTSFSRSEQSESITHNQQEATSSESLHLESAHARNSTQHSLMTEEATTGNTIVNDGLFQHATSTSGDDETTSSMAVGSAMNERSGVTMENTATSDLRSTGSVSFAHAESASNVLDEHSATSVDEANARDLSGGQGDGFQWFESETTQSERRDESTSRDFSFSSATD